MHPNSFRIKAKVFTSYPAASAFLCLTDLMSYYFSNDASPLSLAPFISFSDSLAMYLKLAKAVLQLQRCWDTRYLLSWLAIMGFLLVLEHTT